MSQRCWWILLACGMACTGGAGCSSAPVYCTTELRSYDVKVVRDLNISYEDVEKLSFEACTGPTSREKPRCATGHVASGVLGSGNSTFGTLGGSASHSGGGTHLEARIGFDESAAPEPLPVSLRAIDPTGKVVLEASGTVTWADEECHPHPLLTSL